MLSDLRTRLRALFRHKKVEAELDEELRFHLEQQTLKNMQSGMNPEEAARQARIGLGGIEQAKEEHRDARGVRFLQDTWRDVCYGARMLRKSPGFTAIAIITLALGIGANTAIFSVVDVVMLRPLPAKNPSQLVFLRWRTTQRYFPNAHSLGFYGACSMEGFGLQGLVESAVYSGCSFSEPLLREIERANIFSGVGAFYGLGTTYLSGIGSAVAVDAEAVSGGFFHVLGIKAAAGRLIEPTDNAPAAAPVAVLSYAYWQSAFGGSRDAIGRVIVLGGVPFTIVGVAEPHFTGIIPGANRELWFPLRVYARAKGWHYFPYDDPSTWGLTIIGRLKPGQRRTQAQAAVGGLLYYQMLHGTRPLFTGGQAPARGTGGHGSSGGKPELTLVPAQTGLMGYRELYANPLYLLMFGVGLVLLVACANVAGLMLARANVRQKETAVRLALGAGRRRIVRLLLIESVTLSLLGGALGVLFAYGAAHAITSFVGNVRLEAAGALDPIHLHLLGFTAIDPHILGFTLAVSLLSGILFGLAPAFRNARVDLTPALKEGARGATSSGHAGAGRWFTFGNGLVVAQVALGFVVLTSAGLLVRTLANLRGINLGLDTHHVLSFRVLGGPALKGRQKEIGYRDLARHLAEIPGVLSASYSGALLTNQPGWNFFHWPGTRPGDKEKTDVLGVGPNFFSTMRIPLLSGRLFDTTDFELAAESAGAKPSKAPIPVIVNQNFAREVESVSKENPLGFRFGVVSPTAYWPGRPGFQIIGVVGNTKFYTPQRNPQPLMFEPSGGDFFEVRTAADPRSVVPEVRRTVAQVNPKLALLSVTTESAQIDQLLFRQRLMARLSGILGLLAMALACVGLYGLLSYGTSQRTHEIGIRMALGAQKGAIARLVVEQGFKLALVGTAIGIAGALALTHFISSLLYGVKPADPLTYLGSSVILIGVALAACYLPARRAMRINPMEALRHE